MPGLEAARNPASPAQHAGTVAGALLLIAAVLVLWSGIIGRAFGWLTAIGAMTTSLVWLSHLAIERDRLGERGLSPAVALSTVALIVSGLLLVLHSWGFSVGLMA